MSNHKQTLKSAGLKSLVKDKKSYNKSLITGSIIATIIALTPYIFSLYEGVPDQKVWDTFLFTYESGYYESVYVVTWTLMNKVVPLLLLFIWFFTNRHWWYHVLLVPMAMYFLQIIEVLNDDMNFTDTSNQIFYLIPLMAIIIPSIYLIRAKMFNKINDAGKTMEELEEEFRLGGKGVFGKWSDYF